MQQAIYFSNNPLLPVRGKEHLIGIPINSNQSLARGQVLAQIAAAAASSVQTLSITGTAPTSGQFVISFNGQLTSAIPYNATTAQVQAALQALPNVGSGNVTCTGGPLPGTAVVCTFAGTLANLPEPLMTTQSSTLNTGTAAIAMTTAGVGYKRWVGYNGTLVAAPVAAPTLAGNGSGSAFGAGGYAVQYTFATAAGESTPSPAAFVTLTAGQNIQVGALTGVNAAVTGVNVYANGVYAGQIVPSAGATNATNVSGSSIVTGRTPPISNQAFVYSDGSQIAKAILKWPVTTNESGGVVLGTTSTPQWARDIDAEAFFCGVFVLSDLVGLDANAMSQLGARFIRGAGLSDTTSELMIPGSF
jgi:hypothetical protein